MPKKPPTAFEQSLLARIKAYEHPPRIALSRRFPLLKKPIITTRHASRHLKNVLDLRLKSRQAPEYLPAVVARHQSVLRRRLGDSDARLQEQKVTNLRQAVAKLDGLVIPAGKIFSLWKAIGRPTYAKGYVDGMLLAGGKVVEGLGGGLCQLSNFLYWILLHAPFETVERYHHSLDVFPDSGRTLPFGSGATILYNFIDLKMRNVSGQPLQLKLWLTDTYLKGQVLAATPLPEKFHLFERNHVFVKRGKAYYRYNEICRETLVAGKAVKTEEVAVNFAPVLYRVSPAYLCANRFHVIDLSGLSAPAGLRKAGNRLY